MHDLPSLPSPPIREPARGHVRGFVRSRKPAIAAWLIIVTGVFGGSAVRAVHQHRVATRWVRGELGTISPPGAPHRAPG
jgi:hypothetical protein